MATNYSSEVIKILTSLIKSKNVLISGAPGTGKSTLLAEVAEAFQNINKVNTQGVQPKLNLTGGVAIPPPSSNNGPVLPTFTAQNRKVFQTVFHQNTKYRDFVTGIMPVVSANQNGLNFKVTKGILYRASEFAKQQNSAALIIIDEINRGPAVQIFGDTLVAIESDKRLGVDGSKKNTTHSFELLHPDTGELGEYSLPENLYILGALNQADASVDPLDVAFLRRFEPFKLLPNEQVLRNYYELTDSDKTIDFNNLGPLTPKILFEASVRAWCSINLAISIGRGEECQIGHGVLMSEKDISKMTLSDASEALCRGWEKIIAHVEELFFGDLKGIAVTFNALNSTSTDPYSLDEIEFGDTLRLKLNRPDHLSEKNIFKILKSFIREK
jgi:5-methylcytosine-specific restriction protein B